MLKTVLILSAALEVLFVPWYLKASRYGRSKKTLLLKTVCSTLFLCAGISAYFIAEKSSGYAELILIGLLFGWGGDFLLHVSQKQLCLLAGLISFLLGHICYIAAFSKALQNAFPEVSFFAPADTAAFLLLFGAALIFEIIKRQKFGKALIPVILYSAMLILMFVKAGALGLRTLSASGSGTVPVCLILIAGAALFLISDILLAVKTFIRKEDYYLVIGNIVSYYTAQILIACTLLFI